MTLPDPPLLVITHRRMAPRPLAAVVADALAGGCRWILVREKDLPRPALTALVQEVVALARPYGAWVSVSADAHAAVEAQAHGVHLPWGQDIQATRQVVGSDRWVGVSAHSLAEAQAAAAAGADYVTLSPIFPTESKPGYGPALGLSELHRVSQAVPVPVIALAGITPQNAAACLRAGAAGVAVMGTVMRAADPTRVVRQLVAGLKKRKKIED
ncbi:thiamine phosphate synthase [Litorilinea aerophila]|uniref:Thiamine phosphate synthase n=1 Tax=Litorilinea aerophila TaxID=1204385 RepID=A0A540VG03_9CHLR|nr:thiamine phosphate synthase [Litorilinea aerophila]MCC9076695.1 thiamine phosphate synthase [Litorilinea aerophila]OUC05453.1 hypothetical protein RY27_27235 [Litorilinea aerophila]GIV77741.1 MAG: putative thiamine-phosphate synthase [Litorilinea sp.]